MGYIPTTNALESERLVERDYRIIDQSCRPRDPHIEAISIYSVILWWDRGVHEDFSITSNPTKQLKFDSIIEVH